MWCESPNPNQRNEHAVKRYRFDMIGAHLAGEREHPQIVIRRFAPDACDFESVSIADCWMFSANEILPLPDIIDDVTARSK